jgi:acyl-CoA synthetase (NDP forming)
LGNQIDVCETELVEFFAGESETRVMALYLEGARDGRRFLGVASKTVTEKPVVVLKSGRTDVGQRAAASHTRSLAGRDAVFDAACRQYGIVRVSDVESLYDTAKGLEMLDPPKGHRLFIVTSSGGCGILAADEADQLGLEVPALSEAVVDDLRLAGLLPTAILSNPLDLTVAPAGHFESAVSVAERHGVADLYLLVFGDPIPGATEVVQRLRDAVGNRLAVAYLGGGDVEKSERLRMHEVGIPVFPTPQRAARALGDVARYARSRGRRAAELA